MKKYKLIKEYPGSPKLGFEVFKDGDTYFNHPEFWEEIHPEYVKCINESGGTNFMQKDKIYKIGEIDNFGNYYLVDDRIDSPYTSDHNNGIWYQSRFIPSTKEEYDKQQLKEQLKTLEHGKWYKIFKPNGVCWLICFDKLEDNPQQQTLYNLKSFSYSTEIKYYKSAWGYVTNIRSIKPASQEEVKKYFPEEFEIKEDYEILEGLMPGTIQECPWKLQQNGLYKASGPFCFSLKEILNREFTITKIKRLSDGEIFTVGDKINRLEYNEIVEIFNFVLISEENISNDIAYIISKKENIGKIAIGTTENKLPHILLSEVSKRNKLFTTEDGVDIYDPELKLWDTSDDNWNFLSRTAVGYFIEWRKEGRCKDRKCWFKEENAKNYALKNKRCLSLNDVFETFGGSLPGDFTYKLMDLINKRL